MNKSQLMKKAHELAKTFEGDYSIRLSIALKMLWNRMKATAKNQVLVRDWIAFKNKMVSRHDNVNIKTINSNKFIDVKWDVEKSTEKAVFVSNPDRNNGKSFWVPKSQCHKIA